MHLGDERIGCCRLNEQDKQLRTKQVEDGRGGVLLNEKGEMC